MVVSTVLDDPSYIQFIDGFMERMGIVEECGLDEYSHCGGMVARFVG